MVGDIDASIEQLKAQLRQVRYPGAHLDIPSFRAGRPAGFLPILHYAFLDFSPFFSRFLSENGHELRAKSDLRFLESTYKVLRDHLGYSPVLTTTQFFSTGFAMRKIMFCQDALRLVHQMHVELGGAKNATRGSQFRTRGRSADDSTGNLGSDRLASTIASGMGAMITHEEEVFGGPQPPPTPCALDAEHGASDRHAMAGSSLDVNNARDSSSAASPFFALRALLEEIKGGLEQRFSQLEDRVEACMERFDVHVENSDARTTVLEGQMRIFSAKLQELPLALGSNDSTGSQTKGNGTPSLVSATAEMSNGAAATSFFSSQGYGAKPWARGEVIGTAQTDVEPFWSRPLAQQAPVGEPTHGTAPLEELRDGDAWKYLEGLAGPSSVSTTHLGSHNATTSAIDSNRNDTWMRPVPLSTTHTIVEQHPSAAMDQDTKALIDKLTCKFQDTQELLTKAQDKIYRAGMETHAGAASSQFMGFGDVSGTRM